MILSQWPLQINVTLLCYGIGTPVDLYTMPLVCEEALFVSKNAKKKVIQMIFFLNLSVERLPDNATDRHNTIEKPSKSEFIEINMRVAV